MNHSENKCNSHSYTLQISSYTTPSNFTFDPWNILLLPDQIKCRCTMHSEMRQTTLLHPVRAYIRTNLVWLTIASGIKMLIRPLQYNSLFFITRPPPLETSGFPHILPHYSHLRNSFTNYTWSLGGNYPCAVYCTHVFGSLLSFGASTVYTCSTFSVLSKTMDGVLECNRSSRRVLLHEDQCRNNNCFDVYKLLMSNDIDRLPASWSIYCGDEKQWIILEWPY